MAQPFRAAIFILTGTLALAQAAPAWALFSDDEARRAIIDLRGRLEQLSVRLSNLENSVRSATENASQGQISLLNENEKLRAELSRIRGQVEEISRATNVTGSRSKDLYLDLDTRLRQLEPLTFEFENTAHTVIAREKQLFEKALEILKAADFPKAAESFKTFRAQFPASTLNASALFLEGAAHYAAQNYEPAIFARTRFIELYPDHPKADAALLNLASSQQESKDMAGAKKSLESLIKNYPQSPLVADAQSRLKSMTAPAPRAKPSAPAPRAPAATAAPASPAVAAPPRPAGQ